MASRVFGIGVVTACTVPPFKASKRTAKKNNNKQTKKNPTTPPPKKKTNNNNNNTNQQTNKKQPTRQGQRAWLFVRGNDDVGVCVCVCVCRWKETTGRTAKTCGRKALTAFLPFPLEYSRHIHCFSLPALLSRCYSQGSRRRPRLPLDRDKNITDMYQDKRR